jgi:general secretion pathway protein L
MTPTHLIRLHPDGAAEWLALGRDGRVLAGPQSGLPGEPAEHVTVLLPGEDVLLLRAPRVARQRRQLEQAVPFAIEEQLAAPVEQLHVALDASTAGEDLGVAVLAQARLEHHLAPLRAAGIEPDRVLADVSLLPWQPGSATVWIEGERALLRYGRSAAFAGSVEELPDWLRLLATDARAPERLRWIGAARDVGLDLPIEREDPGLPLRWLATQLAQADAPELLQGRHAPRRARAGAQRVWRWVAILAGVALLSGFAQLVWERQQLQARHAEAREEMEQLLRAAVPGITRVVDPKAQLAAEHSRLGRSGGAGLLPLLARIAPVISGSGQYTIDGLEYRSETLELVVRGADVAALDHLRETLVALTLQVELTSVNPGSGGVEGRLRIKAGRA